MCRLSIFNPAGNCNRTSGGYICHSPDKYLTLSCNTHTHTERDLSVRHCSHSAALPGRLPSCSLLSCEKWFRADKHGLNQSPGTLQGHERRHYTAFLIHTAFSYRFSSLFPQCTCQAGAGGGICMQGHIMHSLSVDCGWWCFAHTKRHLSGGRQGKKRKGVGDYFASWVVCPHLWENSIFTFCN